jgi:biopolymer transport protein ExbB
MHATIRVLPIIAAMLVMIADVSVSFVLAHSSSSVNGTNRTPAGPILSDLMQSAAGSPTSSERLVTPGTTIPNVAVAELPQDLSTWGMFIHANAIVKVVMIGLAVASLVTWTVWVAKNVELLGARAAARRGLRVLAESATFAHAYEKLRNGSGPVVQFMEAAASEVGFSANLRADGLKERIAWQLERIEMAAGR